MIDLLTTIYLLAMNNPKILFAGLPSSGKTTFVAALWYFISKSKDGSLSSTTLIGENSYVNEICGSWLAYEEVPRTKTNSRTIVAMNVTSKADGRSATIQIPDFAGEQFQQHFDNREWDVEYGKMLNEIDGLVLFVNPNEENNRPQFIGLANEIMKLFGQEPQKDAQVTEEWKFDFVPHQVKLVEELQFIEYYGLKEKPLKISVVVSAWDAVESTMGRGSFSPLSWLAANLPLLYQYLVCNTDKYETRFFGVSAQGGNYDSSDLTELMNKRPEERILVLDENGFSNDIGKPLIWLLK